MWTQTLRTGRLTAAHRWSVAACAVAVLALLGAGCEVRQNVVISLNPDSSGQVSITMLMDEEFLAAAGGEGLIDGAVAEMEVAGWSAKPAQDSGFRGFTASARFEDQLALTSLADDLAGHSSLLNGLSSTIWGEAHRHDGRHTPERVGVLFPVRRELDDVHAR